MISIKGQPLADPAFIAERAQALSDGILHCRSHRAHNWRASTVKREKFGYRQVEICADCESSRWQELDRHGFVIKSGMTYSEGYLNPPGSGRVDQAGMAAYRLESVLRRVPARPGRKAAG